MKKKPNHQRELSHIGEVFNLHCECGADPARLARERAEAELRERTARLYAEKYQRTFEQCPGFIGCDAPQGPGRSGRVVVDPAHAEAARFWLKRRFAVNENLSLEAGAGLVFEVITRIGNKARGGKRVKVSFDKPVQFELAL